MTVFHRAQTRLASSYIFVTLGVIGFFLSFIAAGVNEKSVYTQDDFIKYHMLTDRDIEKTPKITRDYYFEYQPGDGYNPSSTIIFNHTLDASPLKNYLNSLGYERQSQILVIVKCGHYQAKRHNPLSISGWIRRTIKFG